MATLNLNPPTTFKTKVAIPVSGAKPVEVEFEFKYRTRPELEAFREELDGMTDVQAVEAMVVGWTLADEFNPANLARLVDNFPGAAFAIGQEYMREQYGRRKAA